MYTLNTERTKEGIVITVSGDYSVSFRDTRYDSKVAVIKYDPDLSEASWLVLIEDKFRVQATDFFNARRYRSLDAAQYSVLAAFCEWKARTGP